MLQTALQCSSIACDTAPVGCAGEDLNEWLAVNTVDFYNAISILFGTLEEFCTARTCPVMSAGPKVRRVFGN